MKPAEFRRFIEGALELGATHLEIRRARANGGAAAIVFMLEQLQGVDPDRTLERMREDVTGGRRRMSRGSFDVLAFRTEDKQRVEVMRDVVVISRDDDDEPSPEGMTVEGASVENQRLALASAREAHRDLRDMAVSMGQTMMAVTESLSARLVESQEKVAQVLQVAFEFSTLQREREQDAAASSERRELGKAAIQELAPIAGAALAHVTKNATPAWGAFAKRLQDTGKLERVLEVVQDDPELMGALGTALGFTFPSKEKSNVASTE